MKRLALLLPLLALALLLAEPGKGERHQLLFVRAEVVDLDGRPLVLS